MPSLLIRYLAFSITLALTTPVFAKDKDQPIYPIITCGKTPIEKSSCMIRTILDDIRTSYTWLDNGGITEIKAIATYSYRAAIPRNEAIDYITYKFELLKNDNLQILIKTKSTESKK
jgi:hypothetical protein